MKTKSTPMLLTCDSLTATSLALSQQASAPVGKSAGEGTCNCLTQQRLTFGRGGEHYRGFGRAVSRPGLADRFVGGEISISVAVAPALPATATSTSPLGSSLSAERCSQPTPRCQRPLLCAHTCLVATKRQSAFKVRDSQTRIHIKERKQ